jgi:hypothetical protein
MGKQWHSLSLVVVAACALTACAPTGNPLVGETIAGQSPAGFLLGVWHGFTLMFTFVASVLTDSVGVYEAHNTGWSYNLGYLLGIMMFFGGGTAGSSRRRRKR